MGVFVKKQHHCMPIHPKIQFTETEIYTRWDQQHNAHTTKSLYRSALNQDSLTLTNLDSHHPGTQIMKGRKSHTLSKNVMH